MKPHSAMDDKTRSQIALYTLGVLERDERADLEKHFEICSACQIEVESYRTVADGLSSLYPDVPPDPRLRDRLLERIRPQARATDAPGASLGRRQPLESASATEPGRVQVWKDWEDAGRSEEARPSMVLVPAKDGSWEPTDAEGVEVRRLFVDRPNDRVTMLVRMAPGTSYPGHRHSGAEECYVLEGDLLVGDRRMRAGDYQWAGAGSHHGIQSTENGCLLFIVSSLHDELDQARR